jgi:hypothetical protein
MIPDLLTLVQRIKNLVYEIAINMLAFHFFDPTRPDSKTKLV